MASDVFRHYVKYYNDYGDIIKTTLGKAREINKVSCARTMVLSLTMLFRDLHRDAGSRIDRQSDEFVGVKVRGNISDQLKTRYEHFYRSRN
jgi:cohesin complex subunit SA-1/2